MSGKRGRVALGIATAMCTSGMTAVSVATPSVPARTYVAQPDTDVPHVAASQPGDPGQAARARARLRDLAELAIARSATLRDLQAGLRAAGAEVREASGARLPQVALDIASRWSEVPSGSTATQLHGQPYYVLSASLPLYDFGRIGAQIDSRRATERAQAERLRLATESLLGELFLAIVEVSRNRAQIEATDRYQQRIDGLSTMLMEVLRADPGRGVELTQVRSRMLQAQVQRAALQSRVRESELALARLLGRNENSPSEVLEAFRDVPPLDELLLAIGTHPSLQQLEAEGDAQANTARAIASGRLPQVSAVAGRTPLNAGISTQYQMYAGVAVSVPLYRGETDLAAQRAALERTTAIEERRAQAALDIETRIRTSNQIATAQRERADEYARLMRVSDQIRVDFFEQWAQLGRRSLFELLAAEAEHHSLRIAHINAVHDSVAAASRSLAESAVLSPWLHLQPAAPW